jgi:hypothetical protein
VGWWQSGANVDTDALTQVVQRMLFTQLANISKQLVSIFIFVHLRNRAYCEGHWTVNRFG